MAFISAHEANYRTQVKRARDAGLECDLTLEEWNQTIKHFGGMCAYCLMAPYQCMDHFVPLCRGGGTTRNNCLPACMSCNSVKKDRNFKRLPPGYGKALEYLEIAQPFEMPPYLPSVVVAKKATQDRNIASYERVLAETIERETAYGITLDKTWLEKQLGRFKKQYRRE